MVLARLFQKLTFRPTRTDNVSTKLEKNKLLLRHRGPEAHGIFIFNGSVLDFGVEPTFYAIAISKHEDQAEADNMLEVVKQHFQT